MKLYVVTRNCYSEQTMFGLYTDPAAALWRFYEVIADQYEQTDYWFLHFVGDHSIEVYETDTDDFNSQDDAVQTALMENVLLPTGYVRYRDDGQLIVLPNEYLKINPDVKWLDERRVDD
jgi:hypothetical protein